MKDLIEFMVKRLLTYADDFTLEEIEENGLITYKMGIHKEDMGRVIGKDGKIIKSIRTLLKVRGLREGKRVELQLLEPPEIS